MRFLWALACCCPLLAFEADPRAVAAFGRYAKLTEEAYPRALWLDDHKHEKSMVWLNQGFVTEHQTLDHGEEIAAPGGVIQDWIAETFIPGVTMDRVREVLLDYANYKDWFKDAVLASRLEKREGDRFEMLLRLHRRQISKVVLNVKYAVEWRPLDETHGSIKAHSTYIGEAKYAKNKPYEEDEPPENEHGFLWRMNMYWRLEAADNGVYAELESITLSRDAGRLAAGRVLNGFVDNFPKDFTRYSCEKLREMLAPATRK